MKKLFSIVLVMSAAVLPANAQDFLSLDDFDQKHKACLEAIAKDADTAYENAMIWQSQGGGRRAKHCVAMALFALGHTDEAAFRLENLAKAPDGGTPVMRAGYTAESAGLWIKAGDPKRAYHVASEGLKTAKTDLDLRLVRAQSYGAMGQWAYAETDLKTALAMHPGNARALRLLARAKFEQNKLNAALTDVEASLRADPTKVETALLRGQIREAMRKKSLKETGAK